mmetsp:Transcript_9162/g.13534  ORF Transcript_9162/g.13534 Transcript_9162/m.13534 type:complete len:101 (+) Transcript_9162:38-340(+)
MSRMEIWSKREAECFSARLQPSKAEPRLELAWASSVAKLAGSPQLFLFRACQPRLNFPALSLGQCSAAWPEGFSLASPGNLAVAKNATSSLSNEAVMSRK